VRDVVESCKHIPCTSLCFARVRCLAASAMTPRGDENKWLPLLTLTPCRIIDRRLPVVILAPEERERKQSKNKREARDRISLAALYSTHWGKSRH
jgi:hypothetical protein